VAASKLDPRTLRAAKEIGRRIQAAREAAGVSQGNLAAKIGMTRGNYARIERGAMNVTLDSLLRIAAGLGMTWTFDLRPMRKGRRREP